MIREAWGGLKEGWGGGRARFFPLFAAAVLTPGLIAGCMTVPTSPGTVAGQTQLDERIAIGVELAYQAAALSATTARQAGLIGDAQWARVKLIDNRAYAGVRAVRAAYRVGNADGYATAFVETQTALKLFLEAVR